MSNDAFLELSKDIDRTFKELDKQLENVSKELDANFLIPKEDPIVFKTRLITEWQERNKRLETFYDTCLEGCRHTKGRPIKGKCGDCQRFDRQWKHFKRRMWVRLIRIWKWL